MNQDPFEVAYTTTQADGAVQANSTDCELLGVRHEQVVAFQLSLKTSRSTSWWPALVAELGQTPVLPMATVQAWDDLPHLGIGAHAARAREFASMVRKVDPAVAVYARVAGGVLDLWTVLPQRDDVAEEAIAEAACELMRKHADLRFDFMIIDEASPSARTIGEAGYDRVIPSAVWVAGPCQAA